MPLLKAGSAFRKREAKIPSRHRRTAEIGAPETKGNGTPIPGLPGAHGPRPYRLEADKKGSPFEEPPKLEREKVCLIRPFEPP